MREATLKLLSPPLSRSHTHLHISNICQLQRPSKPAKRANAIRFRRPTTRGFNSKQGRRDVLQLPLSSIALVSLPVFADDEPSPLFPSDTTSRRRRRRRRLVARLRSGGKSTATSRGCAYTEGNAKGVHSRSGGRFGGENASADGGSARGIASSRKPRCSLPCLRPGRPCVTANWLPLI